MEIAKGIARPALLGSYVNCHDSAMHVAPAVLTTVVTRSSGAPAVASGVTKGVSTLPETNASINPPSTNAVNSTRLARAGAGCGALWRIALGAAQQWE